MCDLIHDIINYCAWCWDMGNINVYSKIVIKNMQRKKDGTKKFFRQIFILKMYFHC